MIAATLGDSGLGGSQRGDAGAIIGRSKLKGDLIEVFCLIKRAGLLKHASQIAGRE